MGRSSPIYTTIRHLLQKGYLGTPELRQSEDGGPPMKIYKLTARVVLCCRQPQLIIER